ncbi:MAG: YitT family protein [Anaeroplasmataceae bacterium]|nr:YitT family protein [Anaeroplasmataceae bacterium]
MRKKKLYDDLFRGLIVVFSSTIYSLAVVWFLEPANLVSIGLTGLGQILNRAFAEINVNIPIGVFTLVANIPLCIYGARKVSPRFVIFTMISVVVQSFWTMGWSWINVDFGINPNEKFFLGVIAGLICGCGIGLALRYGTSTGGVDIIAQALALKKNISIGMFSMIVNIFLAIIAGGLIEKSWDITLYTFIFIIINNLVVDKIHTAYNYLRIDIITNKADEVSQALLDGIQRGCTLAEVKGAYTKEEKFDIFMIISSYELQKAAEIIRATDPTAFMTVSPIKRIFGKFFKHTII